MRINISYMGPEWIANLRRDLLLLLKYSLEDLGHQVTLTNQQIEVGWLNILVSSYFLKPQDMQAIVNTGANIIHLNTEIIKDDLLNFNPDKVDLLNVYLPFMKSGLGILDIVPDNMPEYKRYGMDATFLRWAYHEKLKEINHVAPERKDLDFYFYGFMTDKRKSVVNALHKAGFKGSIHHTCPYFERNSFIERAKVNLNLIQKDIYTHVNAIRIGYLANNQCAILTEEEVDPAGFLEGVKVTNSEKFVSDFADLIRDDNYLRQADETYYWYRQRHMTPIIEEALDSILSKYSKKS